MGSLTDDRPGTRRWYQQATWQGTVVVAFTLVALVLALGTAASPAGATSMEEPSGSTTQAGSYGRDRVLPRRGEPAQLNALLLAAIGGPAVAGGLFLACRPCLARRRSLQQFRSQLRDLDGHQRDFDVTALFQPMSTPGLLAAEERGTRRSRQGRRSPPDEPRKPPNGLEQ